MTTELTTFPTRHGAGDTLAVRRSLADWPATTWSLSFELRNAGASITIAATADGADHVVSVPAATTASWTAGRYHWRAYVTAGTDRHEVERGTIEIEPDFAAAGAADRRSHAEKVLDAIEAVIEGRASKDQESYTIAGRSLARTPIGDLLTLATRYRGMVEAERAAERLRRGIGGRRRVAVRLA
jgi:hypothetical protein